MMDKLTEIIHSTSAWLSSHFVRRTLRGN